MRVNAKADRRRGRKARSGKEKQKPISFGAVPEQIEHWHAAAKAVDRPLSYWIRTACEEKYARDSASIPENLKAS